MSLHHDVVIVGGGPAGLSAALLLGLARRRVVVVDDARPRNASAPISHGLFSRDGVPPGDILAAAREQLTPYPTVELVRDRITTGVQDGWLMTLESESGRVYRGRRLILAAGVADNLPDWPGLAECWGKGIFPCPYCHAYEYRDQPLALIGNGSGVFRTIAVMRSWSKDVALLTNGMPQIEHAERVLLHQRSVPLYDQPIAGFEHVDGELTRVRFTDGKVLSRKAILYHPPAMQKTDLPVTLGLVQYGEFKINANGQTVNPLVYVVGDMVGQFPPAILASAVYGGTAVGRHVNQDLAVEEFTATAH